MYIQTKARLFIFLFLMSLFGFSQTKETIHIGLLLDRHVEELTPYLDQLKHEIKAVVGEDANIEFNDANILSNNLNLERARANYKQLVDNNTSIILSFGVYSNLIIGQQDHYSKPTFMLGSALQDLNGLTPSISGTSGISNFSYLIDSKSYREDLEEFKKLVNYKRVGFVIEAPYYEQEIIKNHLNPLLESTEVKMIPYNTIQDIINNLDGVDAIYFGGGFLLHSQEVKTLSEAFIQAALPTFTSNTIQQVQDGLMVTNQTEDNFDQISRRISLSIEAFVNGTALENLPVFLDLSSRLTVNYNTAQKLGVPIKYSQLNNTDFVGALSDEDIKHQLDLLDVINLVLRDNLSLKASKQNIALSEQNIKGAKANYLPSVSTSATGTYLDPNIAEISNGQNSEYTVAGQVVLQQTLFSEAANANIYIQKNLKEVEQQNYNASQLDAILNVATAYFNVLILKSNVSVQLRNVKLTRQNLKLAEQNFEAGLKGKSDMLRFRSEMAQNTQSMIVAANQLEQGYMGLNQLLNNPIDKDIDIKDVVLNEGIYAQYNYTAFYDLLDDPRQRDLFIEFLILEAKENAPELKSLEHNLLATERNVKLNGAGRLLPTLALQGQYNNTLNRAGKGSDYPQGFPIPPNDNYNLSLNLSLPIFNQNTNNINRQSALIQKEQITYNQDNLKLSIASNIRTSVLNLVNEISNIELSNQSEQSAKEAYELIQVSYSSGAVNIVQLLDAQNNYLNAQLARTNATYNYLIQALQLERDLGSYFLLQPEETNAAFRTRFTQFLEKNNQ